MWEPVSGNFYGLSRAGINRINNPEIVDGGHLPFIRSHAGFVLGFVRTLPIWNWNYPIPIFLLNKDKPIFPPVNGQGFVKCGKQSRTPDDPIPAFPPTNLAISLDDVGVRKGEGSTLKALEFACGYEQKNGRPSIRDKLSYGCIVYAKDLHDNFGKRNREPCSNTSRYTVVQPRGGLSIVSVGEAITTW